MSDDDKQKNGDIETSAGEIQKRILNINPIFVGALQVIEREANSAIAIERAMCKSLMNVRDIELHVRWWLERMKQIKEAAEELAAHFLPNESYESVIELTNERNILKTKLDEIEEAKTKAVEVAIEYGDIDGAHHKMWVIDQVLRLLTNCPTIKKKTFGKRGESYEYEVLGESEEYRKLIQEACDGEDGPNSYTHDIGVAP